MRITTNTVQDNIVSQIQNLSTKQAKLQTQVSTGQRIFQPEDDPASVGRTLNLQSEQRKITQYASNATRALELSQATFSGLNAIKTVSDRASEIATLGSGALSSSQSQAYATEVNQLIEQTLELANSRFGTDYLFGGTKLDTAPFAATRTDGKITAVSYEGNSEQVSLPLSESATVSPTTDEATNLSLRDFLKNLIDLRDSLDTNNSSGLATAQAALIDSEDVLVASLARNGGIQTRIEAHQDQLKDRSTELEKLVSGEVDVDLPETIVKLTQTQTAYEAALQSSVKIMQISLLDYIN
ncbi:flagellar hook-associated protein FlgL [Opitutus sp. ER46]|uniref:flagellar hook-associated protein FlgL n=1 Tax=Opitutus sp. ER46 TaxID=2161864 RepID=UPI000D314748|nr:flagellar hook-associated protein FlgL [Opitutus sp. ER46]PTX90928.1 flagellar hook-associated protein 3 [Opitutus sp. ER46]